jgi:hypothetical protein
MSQDGRAAKNIPDGDGASRHGPLRQQGIERRPQVALGLEAL